jgi:hypothetical protein
MSTTATFDQAKHVLNLISQQGLDVQQIEMLGSGYISALAQGAKDGTLPDLDAFRKSIGLSPLELRIRLESGMTLDGLKAAGKYDWMNDAITAERFPIDPSLVGEHACKVFEPKRNISSEAAVAMMREENFEPARHEHGLAFGAAFPNEQRKRPIACLGSSARVRGGRRVVCLAGGGAERGLRLGRWGGGWPGGWGFLGVRKVSGA